MHLHPTVRLVQAQRRTGSPGFTLIELLVVIGIVALLLTIATTSFFGATKQESITKSRNQLRDVLLMARQQACILGKPHVVVCWNTKTTVQVGNNEQQATQGRYALFQYVGQAWAKGKNLLAPFGLQRELLSGALHKNSRLINLNEPDKPFMRVSAIPNDSTLTKEQNESQRFSGTTNLQYPYYAEGSAADQFVPPFNENLIGYDGAETYNFLVAELRSTVHDKSDNDTGSFPIAVRVSETYSLPQYYQFSKKRAIFYFTADGRLLHEEAEGKTNTISAAHSVSSNKQNQSFSVKVESDGQVKVQN